MPASAVRDQIATLIDDVFGVPSDALGDDVLLQEGLQLDSLSVVELQMVIEDSFDIRLGGDDVEDIQTVGQLVAAVEQAVRMSRPVTADGAADDGALTADDEARSA